MAKKNDIDSLFSDDQKPVKSQDFASLFEASLAITDKKLSVGDTFDAQILSLGKEESFVSTGTPVDAKISNVDLMDENKILKYGVGDIVKVTVLRVRPDEIRVTRKGSKSSPVDLDSLEDAFDMELAVEGKITEVIKGGYCVSVQGQMAFCPVSQLAMAVPNEAKDLIGKKFEFLITEFNSAKRNIVVSRRRLLDLQKAENEGIFLEKHQEGDIVSGTVTRVEQYGAFVDLGGGVEGLVHVSEIGFIRLKHAIDGASPGDKVQVKILKAEDVGGRLKISLSIKQAGGAQDPWMQVPLQFPVGTIVDATVDKKEAFGLFVVLIPGVNGLLPKSKWKDTDEASDYENKRKGDAIRVRVDEIKFEERKISLGLPTEVDDGAWRSHENTQSLGALALAFSQAKTNKK